MRKWLARRGTEKLRSSPASASPAWRGAGQSADGSFCLGRSGLGGLPAPGPTVRTASCLVDWSSATSGACGPRRRRGIRRRVRLRRRLERPARLGEQAEQMFGNEPVRRRDVPVAVRGLAMVKKRAGDDRCRSSPARVMATWSRRRLPDLGRTAGSRDPSATHRPR